jgi:hypothetical protein
MALDTIIALVLSSGIIYYLIQRGLTSMIIWLALIYLVAAKGAKFSETFSVIVGLVGIYLISMITTRTWENYENEDEKKEKDKKKGAPEGAPPKTKSSRKDVPSGPHVDVGTTILHAYRNLTPEQLGGMRRDTKELMALQKELMGSLSEMKPAIEQGAELLKTFGTFFGKPGQQGAA